MTDFKYDLDNDVHQLTCKKNTLVRTLKREFQEGVDYVYHKEYTKGRPRGIYEITLNCRRQLLVKYALSARRQLSPMVDLKIDYIKRYLPKEIETLNFVSTALSGVYTITRQHWLMNGKYRIDMYFPEHRIAVECDEHGHVDRDPLYESRRERELVAALNCTFVRFNPDAHDFCMAVLISRILLAIRSTACIVNESAR